MEIVRKIEQSLRSYLAEDDKKILFMWGPRRSGKTTVLKKIAKEYDLRIFNFDFIEDREFFKPSRESLDKIVKTTKLILIDEVQNYPEATLALKLLHDEYDVKIIATGSSELRQTTNDFDTLAGRYTEIFCLPLSFDEALNHQTADILDFSRLTRTELHKQLVFGSYPEVYLLDGGDDIKQDLLANIINTYVLKDVVNIYKLKDLKLARDILTKIALQIGSEVSLREVANSLQANVSTVSNYIEIFLKNYILIGLPSFKTNLRRAVSENKKYYFYDLGLRNSLIKDFRDLALRQDKGAVFENYIVSEIEKIKHYSAHNFSTYFYREYDGKEVDLVIEDYKKQYRVFDIKLTKGVGAVNDIFPLQHELDVINLENYYQSLLSLK